MSVKSKLASAKGHITRAQVFARTIDSSATSELLSNRLEKLEETWTSYCGLHDEHLASVDEDAQGELIAEFGEYEERYFFAQAEMSRVLHSLRPVLSSNDSNETILERLANQQSTFLERLNDSGTRDANVQLPKIVIPRFSGNYKEWPSFRDLFKGSVDSNVNLTPTQKLQYLKSFLSDEAASLIKHIIISDTNYSEAWSRLEVRYNQEHLIVKSFIQSYLSLPSTNIANAHILRKITDGADEVVRGLNALKKTSRDPWLIHLLVNKLDQDSCQAWAEYSCSQKELTIEVLLDFLHKRCNALESCQSNPRPVPSRVKPITLLRSHVSENKVSKIRCPQCAEYHLLSQCPKFLSCDIQSRREFVKAQSLCFNCLRVGHSANKCRSAFRCRVCKSTHHTLVHLKNAPVNNVSSVNLALPLSSASSFSDNLSNSVVAPVQPSLLVNNLSLDPYRCKQTILPTISASVKDILGNPIKCRVLLDSGSQSSFILDAFAKRLGYPRTHARIPIRGLSSLNAGHTKGRISIELSSLDNSSSLRVDTFILTKLTSNLPCQTFDNSIWPHITGLQLADPKFNVQSPIDILLGADKLWCILKAGQVRGDEGAPVAQNTTFGWVVSGEFLTNLRSDAQSIESLNITLDVDHLLRRFWEVEEISPSEGEFANDPAEQHFQKHFSRASDGKYVVALPFKTPDPIFSDTLAAAVSRQHSMERRFRSNPELHRLYSEFMTEYISLGHMTRIHPNQGNLTHGKQFYLPHHAVIKLDSTTTKLRVVFDGSAKDSKGVSLNSSLLVGPPIQRDLIGVCLRFRQHRFVFTADVIKMFRQVWVNDPDTEFQRIVWRADPQDELQHFRLLTVTYGTASAPFLSVRVLKQLASDYQSEYSLAAKILLEDVYVDDVMTGSNSPNELIALKSELVSLLAEAKLQLRKWCSNCLPFLKTVPLEDRTSSLFDPEHSNSFVKVLGMFWDPLIDKYSFRISKTTFTRPPTRRSLLSEVARIFDPLGFLAPSVVLFKILFQELWSSDLNLRWDDPLPDPLSMRWINYREELHLFEQLRIPRYACPSQELELHGFSDASSAAYAAVIYSRWKTKDGKNQVNLIIAKTKVAPLKPVSIPRLELCGAVLLTRLFSLVLSALSSKPTNIFAWCDSEIVLHWLSSPPRRWTTFIANRTSFILDTVPRHSWQHVISEHNPADCASRGLTPARLLTHEMWWNGPHWLSLELSEWPQSKFNLNNVSNPSLEEKMPTSRALTIIFTNELLDVLMVRFSSWHRMQKVIAYCCRFIFNCRQSQINRRGSHLQLFEIRHAKIHILRMVQFTLFNVDIQSLVQGRRLSSRSKLCSLAPFIDKQGILRVGGRIQQAPVSFNIKHPIILCSSHPISSLIIADLHHKYLHPGISETFSLVRQQYWILGARNLVRKILFRCKPCFLQRKQTCQQMMGNLPSYRLQPCRPFFNTGVDYAGPLTIKISMTRKPTLSKAYIAVFVCMSTKAIHLELVGDLTTEAFIAALRRFMARRGRCGNIYSDNGSNFKGARRCLTELQKHVFSSSHIKKVSGALADDGVAWHFMPPSAPHFGGLWEAAVKSIKFHLRRVIGSTVLTFEALSTVLCQIEAILNSRPLCWLSDTDINPLTPSHFLIGEPLTALPEPSYVEIPTNRLSHYQQLQAMVQGFWKRWHMEYLTSLQERPKWQQSTPNVKVGDLVIVKEPNQPPTKWVLGRILEVNYGRDNLARVASVKTADGVFIRPIRKLAILPVS